MVVDYVEKGMVRDIGQCIYCGARGKSVKLQKEHVIPFSLGSNTYLKNASCRTCAAITRSFETHLSRNIYGHMRVHSKIQTRNPEERPRELPVIVARRGVESKLVLPVDKHPYFLILPIWDQPGFFRGEQPHSGFTGLNYHIFYYVPPNIKETLGIEDDFGSFDHDGRTIFWKIDLYDLDHQFYSPDPTDPSKTNRVLTILLAEEY